MVHMLQYRIYISSSTRFTPKPYKSGRPSQWSVGKGVPTSNICETRHAKHQWMVLYSLHCRRKEGRKERRKESTTNVNESYMGMNFHLCTHFLWDKKHDSIRAGLHHGPWKMAFSMVQLPWSDFLKWLKQYFSVMGPFHFLPKRLFCFSHRKTRWSVSVNNVRLKICSCGDLELMITLTFFPLV